MRLGSPASLKQNDMVSIHASVKDATQLIRRCNRTTICFNPRICKRCDCNWCCKSSICRVSIHASVKDATCGSGCFDYINKVSIHASVKDATKAQLELFGADGVSIHASVKDATKRLYRVNLGRMVSIHASVKDATDAKSAPLLHKKFQSTHL